MSQDPAFDLVKSLTPNEKRFFRLQSGEDKNYLYVFDALDSMKEYDGDVLKKKLKNKKINVSYEKNYLGKQILKVLRNISSLDSPFLQTNSLMADVEILYSKRMLVAALQKTAEAKQIALKFDYFGLYIELLSIEKRIQILSPEPDIEKFFARLEKEQADVLAMLNNLYEYVSINSRIHAITVARGGLMRKEDVEAFESLLKGPAMSDIKNALSPSAKMLFYSIKMGYSFFSGDPETALVYNNECIKAFEEHQPLFEKNPQNYVSMVANSCIIMMNAARYSEARALLAKLAEIESRFDFKPSYTVRSDIFETVMKLEIAIATQSGTFENITALTRQVTEGLQQYKKGLSEYDNLIISYYLAIINYFDGKVSNAQKILNEIVNEKARTMAEDYYLHSKLLLSLIHFEKENYDLSVKLVKNITADFNGLVKLIKDFVSNKKHEVYTEKDKKALYKKFRQTAEEWSKNNRPLLFFPILQWIDNKL